MSRLPSRQAFLLCPTLLGGVVAPIAAVLITWHTSRNHPGVETYFYLIDGMLTQLVLVPLTLLMVVRRPEKAMTLVFVALTFFSGAQQLSGSYAAEALLVPARETLPGGVAAQFGQALFQTWVVLTFLLLLAIFPNGRPLSPRWSWLTWAISFLFVVVPINGVLIPEHPFTFDPEPTPLVIYSIEGPLANTSSWFKEVVAVASTMSFVVLVGLLVGIFVRFRRVVGVERQQIKWFFFSVAFGLSFFLIGGLIPGSVGEEVATAGYAWLGRTLLNPWMIVPALIVGSMALAVLRFGLYDINRIISRTLSYALLVGLMALVFAAGVVLLPNLIPGLGGSPLLVAGSTLAVAALFNPVRKRVQATVDRRFNRSRYDAEKVLDQFAGTLRDRVDPESVVAGWVGAVSETMQPQTVSVWVKQ